jgi:hypothetical protein
MFFVLPIVLSLAMVVLYESDVIMSGSKTGHDVLEYQAVMVMELLTICLIPLALRLFKFKSVHRQVADASGRGLKKWGAIRICMIAVPMLINTFLYYQFMNVAFGYMGIIGLLSLVFVYPSKEKCEQEIRD